jgi:hypothetical protein
MIAHGLDWRPGDNVIIPANGFNWFGLLPGPGRACGVVRLGYGVCPLGKSETSPVISMNPSADQRLLICLAGGPGLH